MTVNGAAMVDVHEVSQVFRTAQAERVALENVSCSIKTGSFVSLIGASGCGKTTLLRIMAGLTEQTSGDVSVGGGAPELGRPDVAYVFQQDALWPWRTIESAVSFPLEMRGVPKSIRKRRSREALEMVGLRGHEDAYPHQLSGGMRQRVNICRALVTEPSLLLMDEPFAALDPQTREYLQVQLARIVDESSLTCVFVTHDISEAIYLSDQVVVLSASPGTVREVIDIPFERGRDLHIKRTAEFQSYVDRIWNLIDDDVRKAIDQTV